MRKLEICRFEPYHPKLCHPERSEGSHRNTGRSFATLRMTGFRMTVAMLRVMGILLLSSITHAHPLSPARISLNLEHADLPATLRMVAQFSHRDVLVSEEVKGALSAHFENISANQLFDVLLASEQLAKQKIGPVWLIAPKKTIENTTPLLTRVWHVQYATAADIAKLFHDDHRGLLSHHGNIRVDARTNLILIQDLPDHLIAANHLIRMLDVPVYQIRIQARLVSVESEFAQALGVRFAYHQTIGHHALSIATLDDNALLAVQLSALEKAGRATLISNPSLFTANQQPASIEAGEEIPYQEVSEMGGTAAVFKKAVLGLKVTPQVLPHHQILLHMQINQDRPSNHIVQGVPAINTRQIITQVLVQDGHTVVLGGIYERSEERRVG